MTKRALIDPFLVASPQAVSARTRLFPSDSDETVLREIGEHLGSLLCSDLATRCRLGVGPKYLGRAKRKRSLTPHCSSRWAGAITRTTDDMWERELFNLEDLEYRDRKELAELDRRLALPVGKGKKKKRGYATKGERYQKQCRRQKLATRLSDTEQRLAEGRLSIVLGGARLARKRHNLQSAGITLEQWCYQWNAKRMFISADGETGKPFGNETIRVAPHGNAEHTVTIRLPSPFAHLSNTPGRTPTYRLSAPVQWHHLAEEWNTQASSDRAVGYHIRFDADRERWYITASWSQPPKKSPSVKEAARSGRCLAIDLNSGHVDARILDVHGNPVGRPIRKNIPERGFSAHRLGALREAVSQLVKWAQQQGVTVIAIEKLDFTDIRTRQRGRRGKAGKTTRRKVCGIPTSRFVHTIASAAYRNGMTVIAVDPAYTSIWGARYWKKPLDRSRRQRGDRHQAAAVVIGRRSQGYSEKRKSSQSPCLPEDRHGKATVQQTANATGMAHTSDNDRRERSHSVGVTTARAEP